MSNSDGVEPDSPRPNNRANIASEPWNQNVNGPDCAKSAGPICAKSARPIMQHAPCPQPRLRCYMALSRPRQNGVAKRRSFLTRLALGCCSASEVESFYETQKLRGHAARWPGTTRSTPLHKHCPEPQASGLRLPTPEIPPQPHTKPNSRAGSGRTGIPAPSARNKRPRNPCETAPKTPRREVRPHQPKKSLRAKAGAEARRAAWPSTAADKQA